MEVHSIDDAKKAAKYLLGFVTTAVVVTLGGKGAVLATPNEVKYIPAKPVKAVDTTVTFSSSLRLCSR